MRARNRYQQWLRERAEVAQHSIEMQRNLIADARRANDAAVPWWEQLFYVYRQPEEDDCDL